MFSESQRNILIKLCDKEIDRQLTLPEKVEFDVFIDVLDCLMILRKLPK